MKRAVMILGVIFLGQTTIANSATDWTSYLKPMMSGCKHPNPTDKLPARYKASIVSTKVKIGSEDYDIVGYRGDKITTYSLKNATAFGQPLLKIEHLQGYEWAYLELYFKDTKFMALRPQFKLPKVNDVENEGFHIIQNNENGYKVDDGMWETNLKFDKKQKTIICS